MPRLKNYTYIEQDVVIPGPGFQLIPHLLYTNCGVGFASQKITLTPVDINGVGCYAIGIGNDGFTLVGTAGGHVRVQVQAVHSVQQ